MQLPNHISSAISDTDRIWIYQADRFLTEQEVKIAQKELDDFTKLWTAHQHQLNAKAFVAFDLFVIIAVDENAYPATGCSIDKSVAFIKQLGEKLHTDLLQRTNLAWIEDNQIQISRLDSLGEVSLHEGTLIFNNLVTNGHELKNNWIVRVSDSWLKRYLPAATS